MSTASKEDAVSNEESEKRRRGGLNRTCELFKGCQQRKIKCVVVSHRFTAGTQKCSRCSKFKLDCVFPPPAIRRRRNKNDARIKALEQKLQELQDAIPDASPQLDLGNLYSDPLSLNISWDSGSQQQSNSLGNSLSSLTLTSSGQTFSSSEDPVSSGLVGFEFAQILFSAFRKDMAPIYPLVLLPTHWTCQNARETKPALFRAILSVASSKRDPEFSKALFRDAAKYVTEEVAIRGSKSLDLIQALLVLAAWYCPMENFPNLMFSQYANMAITIALDLKSSNDEQYWIPSVNKAFVHSEQLVETCRTFLACYFISSSMAFSFRRPSVLCRGPWLDDCIRVLETAPSIHLNDCRLIEWAKLQIIAEESISVTGLYSGSHVDFSDDKICRVLKYGVECAAAWKQRVSAMTIHEPMIIHYHMVLMSLQEPAFYDGHDMEDFRPPYKLRPLPLAKNIDNYYSLSIANSLSQCVSSAQKVINTFLAIPIETLRIMPVIVYTRITYAAVVLMKFDVSSRIPQSVACLLDDVELNPKVLFLQLLNKLSLVEGSKHCLVPYIFRGALSRMTRWYIDQFESLETPELDITFEPMMDVGTDIAQHNADANHRANVELSTPISGSNESVPSLHLFEMEYP